MLIRILLAMLVTGTQISAEGLSIVGPTEGDVGQPVRLLVQGLPKLDTTKPVGEGLKWLDAISIRCSAPARLDERGPSFQPQASGLEPHLSKRVGLGLSPLAWQLELEFKPFAPGAYVVIVDSNHPPFDLAIHRVEIRGPPDPVNPVHPVKNQFIPNTTGVDQFSVLILEEQQSRGDLSAGHRDVILATDDESVRSWLDKNTEAGPDGSRGFRILDQDTDLVRDAKRWQQLSSLAPESPSLPYLVAVHGACAFVGPLPSDRAKTLQVLEAVKGVRRDK